MKRARDTQSDLPVSFPEVVFQRRALVLKGMPFERWLELGKVLGEIEDAVQFWIGDYLNDGEKAYGEKYAQAVDVKQARAWANYAWVARSVPKSLRKDISYKHHEAVAPLDPKDQAKWLTDAVDNKWPVSELRTRIRLFRNPPPKLDCRDSGDGPEVLPDPEPEFQEVAEVRPSYHYSEIPERVVTDVPSEKVSTDGDLKHLIGLVRSLRTAVRGDLSRGIKPDAAAASRYWGALDTFLARFE